jgi:hypothetical protein
MSTLGSILHYIGLFSIILFGFHSIYATKKRIECFSYYDPEKKYHYITLIGNPRFHINKFNEAPKEMLECSKKYVPVSILLLSVSLLCLSLEYLIS